MSVMLRVRTFFHQTFRVYHVYLNFILGCICRITVHLVTLKDESLMLKGVLHPRPIFDCFLHFIKKLQHIGDKKNMFFIGNILRNLTTALEFHWLKWLLIYGSKPEKYCVSHIVYSNLTTMVSTEIKL